MHSPIATKLRALISFMKSVMICTNHRCEKKIRTQIQTLLCWKRNKFSLMLNAPFTLFVAWSQFSLCKHKNIVMLHYEWAASGSIYLFIWTHGHEPGEWELALSAHAVGSLRFWLLLLLLLLKWHRNWLNAREISLKFWKLWEELLLNFSAQSTIQRQNLVTFRIPTPISNSKVEISFCFSCRSLHSYRWFDSAFIQRILLI